MASEQTLTADEIISVLGDSTTTVSQLNDLSKKYKIPLSKLVRVHEKKDSSDVITQIFTERAQLLDQYRSHAERVMSVLRTESYNGQAPKLSADDIQRMMRKALSEVFVELDSDLDYDLYTQEQIAKFVADVLTSASKIHSPQNNSYGYGLQGMQMLVGASGSSNLWVQIDQWCRDNSIEDVAEYSILDYLPYHSTPIRNVNPYGINYLLENSIPLGVPCEGAITNSERIEKMKKWLKNLILPGSLLHCIVSKMDLLLTLATGTASKLLILRETFAQFVHKHSARCGLTVDCSTYPTIDKTIVKCVLRYENDKFPTITTYDSVEKKCKIMDRNDFHDALDNRRVMMDILSEYYRLISEQV